MPKPSERSVLPRWRTSADTLAADFPSTQRQPRQESNANLALIERKAREFSQARCIGLASDLLAHSNSPSAHDVLRDAARFVLDRPAGSVPGPLRNAAELVCGVDVPKAALRATQTTGVAIHHLRAKLRINSRDPLGHVDLARAYTISGNDVGADRHLRVAAQLAPNNRFILRSAARFFAHKSEPERARHLLLASPRTARDPWLMASLVSFETILDDTRSSSKAMKMLKDDRHAPADIAELACALSALEYRQGAYRESRKLLNKGLEVPNDNAVAQALWFSDSTGIEIHKQDAWLRNSFAFEARYYERYSSSDFDSAVTEALEWYEDEPFSSRPLQAASYILGVLGRYEEAKDCALRGLMFREENSVLRNNLAFVLMASGALKEGEQELARAIEFEKGQGNKLSPHTKANGGMLFYRCGDAETGERLYRIAAQEYSTLRGGHEPAALAMAHMALEAARSKTANAEKLALEAEAYHKKHPYPASRFILDSIKRLTGAEPVKQDVSSSKQLVVDGRTWRYDSSTNTLIVENAKPFKD
jgi:Flp pilus assembly protein TadD